MANFPPLKARLLLALDDAVARFGIDGPFVDFGAGRGDVAAHLVQRHGLSGALVESSGECRSVYRDDPSLAQLPVYSALSEVPARQFRLALAFDVLEHLPDPVAALRDLHTRLQAAGVLIAVVPYRPRAWGWDDTYYGHLNRWSRAAFESLLRSSGFEVVHRLDPTFPVYRLMRKIMLALYRPPPLPADPQAATRSSATQNAWGMVPAWTQWRCWTVVNRLCRLTEQVYLGDELFVVARALPARLP